MKKCVKCGQINSDDAQFCNNCGSRLPEDMLTKICPFCRAAIPSEATFCQKCGQKQPDPHAGDEPIKVQPMMAPKTPVVEDLDDLTESYDAQGDTGYSRRGRKKSSFGRQLKERYDTADTGNTEDDGFDDVSYGESRSGSRRYESSSYDDDRYSSDSYSDSRYADDYDDRYDDYDDYDERDGLGNGLKIAIAVLSVAVILVLALVAFLIFGRGAKKKNNDAKATTAAQVQETKAAETKAKETAAAPAETAPAQTYGQPQMLPSSLKASSSLDSQNYQAAYMTDLNADTCWAEGASGLGEGSEITYSFSGKQWVYGIAVMPGFQRNQEFYDKNGVPTKLTIDTGKVQIPISLENYTPNFSNPTASVAYFQFSQPVQAETLTVKIDSAKAGTTDEDTCITEMFFYSYAADEASAAKSRPKVLAVGETQAAPETQPAAGESQAAGGEAQPTEAAADGDYILPNSDKAYLTQEDLAGLTKEQLRIARNEIFARHGRTFGDGELQKYFESKSWYNGTLSGDQFDSNVLNKFEEANISAIHKAEEKLNGQ